jgi:hypothetical protein
MRDQHEVFDAGIARETPVWRYFDLARFLSLLENRALYFSRADKLGDPLEGSLTKGTVAWRDEWLRNPPQGMSRDEIDKLIRQNSGLYESLPQKIYINCWHLGAHESMAMWRGYGAGPYGVAIRSTFGVLYDTLPSKLQYAGHEESIFLGPVRYLDYSSVAERIPHENNVFGPYMCKSVAYQHETELRAVFADFFKLGEKREEAPAGHFVDIDLSRLVQAVIVSPLAPDWFEGVMRSTCARFGFNFDITTSSVFMPPIF